MSGVVPLDKSLAGRDLEVKGVQVVKGAFEVETIRAPEAQGGSEERAMGIVGLSIHAANVMTSRAAVRNLKQTQTPRKLHFQQSVITVAPCDVCPQLSHGAAVYPFRSWEAVPSDGAVAASEPFQEPFRERPL